MCTLEQFIQNESVDWGWGLHSGMRDCSKINEMSEWSTVNVT